MTKPQSRRDTIAMIAKGMIAITSETSKEDTGDSDLSVHEATIRMLSKETSKGAYILCTGASIMADVIVYELYGEDGLKILRMEFDKQLQQLDHITQQ